MGWKSKVQKILMGNHPLGVPQSRRKVIDIAAVWSPMLTLPNFTGSSIFGFAVAIGWPPCSWCALLQASTARVSRQSLSRLPQRSDTALNFRRTASSNFTPSRAQSRSA